VTYERTKYPGGTCRKSIRFFKTLSALDQLFEDRAELKRRAEEQLLQGPLANAMTHIGQLAILRRMSSSPIPKDNFDEARISPGNISSPSS
jgi:hypothetical protein